MKTESLEQIATVMANVVKPLQKRIEELEAADQQKAYRLRQLETTAEADAIRIKELEQLAEGREGYTGNRRYVPTH